MSYVYIANAENIPEWQQCDFDHETIDHMMAFIAKCKTLLNNLKLLQQNPNTQNQLFVSTAPLAKHYADRVNHILYFEQTNLHSYKNQEELIVVNFLQYKIYQIQEKYIEYRFAAQILKYNSKQIRMIIQNLYIEAFYLSIVAKQNIKYQKKVIVQVNQQLKSRPDQVLFHINPRLPRIRLECYKLRDKIELLYDLCLINQTGGKLRREEKLLQIYQHRRHWDVLEFIIIGAFMGGLALFVGIIVILLIQNQQINQDKNQYFLASFPVWRGACQIIFYLWVLSLNMLLFKASKINYKLIFSFYDYSFPSATYFWIAASIFSFLFLSLLTMFLLQLAGILNWGFLHYGQIFWIIFLLYFFNPFPVLHSQGRYFLMKTLVRVFVSCCFPMDFYIIWAAQQTVSLTQPTSDLFYTIFFFITKNKADSLAVTGNFNSALVISLFIMRIYQNLKFWLQVSKKSNNYNFIAPQFLGTIRATFGLFTAVAALLNRLKVFQNAFVLWIIMIIISTLIACYVDVRGDWGLFSHQSRTFLRKKLLFPKARPVYYFFIVFNLVLRTAWALTISPFFLNSSKSDSSLFIMMISLLEIFRRGVWNYLRLEFQHIRNCNQYQATVKDNDIYQEVKKQINQKYKINKTNTQTEMDKKNTSSEFIHKLYFSVDQKRKENPLMVRKPSTRKLIEQYLEVNQNKLTKRRIKHQFQMFKHSLQFRLKLGKQVKDILQVHQKQIQMIQEKLKVH